MDQNEKQEKRREGLRRLGAQRRRASELRRRVVVTSLAAFALLWAVVFAQMATGNDPVLGEGSKALTGSTARATRAKGVARAKEARVATAQARAQARRASREANADAEIEAAEAEAQAIEAEEAFAAEEPEPVITSQS